jgi:hypothetical protein
MSEPSQVRHIFFFLFSFLILAFRRRFNALQYVVSGYLRTPIHQPAGQSHTLFLSPSLPLSLSACFLPAVCVGVRPIQLVGSSNQESITHPFPFRILRLWRQKKKIFDTIHPPSIFEESRKKGGVFLAFPLSFLFWGLRPRLFDLGTAAPTLKVAFFKSVRVDTTSLFFPTFWLNLSSIS